MQPRCAGTPKVILSATKAPAGLTPGTKFFPLWGPCTASPTRIPELPSKV